MALVDVGPDLDIKDVSVTLTAGNSQAAARFRANATVNVAQFGNQGFKPSRWLVQWQKEAGVWKIVEVQRMHLIKDEPMGILDRDGG